MARKRGFKNPNNPLDFFFKVVYYYNMKKYTFEEIKEFARQIENKEIKETKEVLRRKDEGGWSVAHELAFPSDVTNWSTGDKEILKLKDKGKWSVAHELAYIHPTWSTGDIEVLSLADKYGCTVEDVLVKKGKM